MQTRNNLSSCHYLRDFVNYRESFGMSFNYALKIQACVSSFIAWNSRGAATFTESLRRKKRNPHLSLFPPWPSMPLPCFGVLDGDDTWLSGFKTRRPNLRASLNVTWKQPKKRCREQHLRRNVNSSCKLRKKRLFFSARTTIKTEIVQRFKYLQQQLNSSPIVYGSNFLKQTVLADRKHMLRWRLAREFMFWQYSLLIFNDSFVVTKTLGSLQAFEESADWALLSSFCGEPNLHISIFKWLLSTMEDKQGIKICR